LATWAILFSLLLVKQSPAELPGCLQGFAFYSHDGSLFKDRDSIASGKVGSNGPIEFGIEAKSSGDVVSGANVLLRDRAKIFGNVTAAGNITLYSGAQVMGTMLQNATVSPCLIPQDTFTVGSQDHSIYAGNSLTLSPGAYRDIHVYSNGELKLNAGVYRFKSLITEPDGKYKFNPDTGTIEIKVSQQFSVGDRSKFNFVDTVLPGKIKFHTQQTAQLNIGTDLTFRANLLAPRAKIHSQSRTLFYGAVFGKSLEFEPDVQIYGTPLDQPPTVAILSPVSGFLTNQDTISVTWSVNGVVQAAQTQEILLQEGIQTITRCSDTVCVSVLVNRDITPPSIVIDSPVDGTTTPLASLPVAWSVDGVAQTQQLSATLVEGINTITRSATDAAGNVGTASVAVRLDSQGPDITIHRPASGDTLATLLTSIEVSYRDEFSGIRLASFSAKVDGRELSADLQVLADTAFGVLYLASGDHTLTIAVEDDLGNRSEVSHAFTLALPTPSLSIVSPQNFTTVRTADILVIGTLVGQVTDLLVGGVAATVTGNSFSALVPLNDGRNTILATGFDGNGKMVSATLTVTLDREKPRIYFASPREGMSLTTASVVVTGAVSDRIADVRGQSMPSVTVNGNPASVDNFNFSATVNLTPGENTITAIATDEAGNSESAVLKLNRISVNEAALLIESGQGQTATVLSPLSQPLRISVKNETGTPLSNRTVVFRVSLGDGVLDGGLRILNRTTDANGEAEVSFTIGKRSGPGANQVSVTSPGLPGEVIFLANATPSPNLRIHTASGDMQRGLAGAPAPHPLIAIVTDEKSNPITGATVRFTVKKGGGHFQGETSFASVTGADGRAAASFTLGFEEGRDNNLVEATIDGHEATNPGVFVLSGYVPGPPADTKVSGVVLDNSNQPIPGVTIRIEGSGQQAATDAQGRFTIANAPVGALHLFVDGSTATRPGDWVTLMFEMNSISGKNNDIGMPLYLVPRNNAEAKVASASQERVITLSEIPGFALRVPPGSAIFPADMEDHTVSVTQVHTDKIPMPPGEGMQPRFIISIGPPSVKFDPPAPITYPNVDGLRPGEQTHFYSFDHDLGTYVSIGTGTVSEDGMTITSDKGFGIVKGGWHCAGPSNPSGGAEPPSVRLAAKPSSKVCQDDVLTIETSCKPVLGTMEWSAPGASIDSKSEEIVTDNGTPLLFSTSYPTSGSKAITGTWTCKSGAQTTEEIQIEVEEKPEEIQGVFPDETILAQIVPTSASKTYNVNGLTASEVATQLTAYANNHEGEAGSMEGLFNRPLPAFLAPQVDDAGCGLKTYTYKMIKPIITTSTLIELPEWVNRNSPAADPEAKTRFDSFMQCLEPHETMHQTLYNESVNENLPFLFKYKIIIRSSKTPVEIRLIVSEIQRSLYSALESNYNSAKTSIDLKTKSIDPTTCIF